MMGESKQETNRKETKETKETMSNTNTNLEQLSKLLKLVAANEGVLEGKSSDVMDSLVRAIQRTIDMNEQTNSSGNNDLANLIVNDCVAHIQGATIPSDNEMEVRESLHPCYPGSKYEGKPIVFPNARAMRISFQRNLCGIGHDTQSKTTRLTFYDSSGTKVLKVFTPKSLDTPSSKVFASFTTTESHVRYRFSLANNAPHTLHGFKFIARPLRGLGKGTYSCVCVAFFDRLRPSLLLLSLLLLFLRLLLLSFFAVEDHCIYTDIKINIYHCLSTTIFFTLLLQPPPPPFPLLTPPPCIHTGTPILFQVYG